ncbi:N-alpha-acetyltransferase 16, NatA auxiliary subunit, partial [Cladochytrium tenue]
MTATASTATARKRADLPSKEASILKAVMKFYENKQYKKGMKSCDQILRKCPEHGETLSMKALFLSYLERKDEAHELIKKAVRLEITNAVCWHVYGLIHRAEKNYEEAVKCYAQAMRLDKENVQMFRDNAMLQIHIRNYEAFVAYWISLAVSYHVVRNYDAALEVLQHYFDMFMTYVEPNVEYENSEFYLYRTQVLSDAGRHQDALDYLTKYEKKILDKKGMKEARAPLLSEVGDEKAAEAACMVLVKLNPDSYDYIKQLLKAKHLDGDALDEEKTSRIFELFEDLADQFGRSNAIRRVPLNYATGERFARRIDSYMRPMFRKGVPSLFVSINALYGDSSRMEAVESLVTGYESLLRANSSFEANASESTDGDLPDLEPPSALLWVLYYLAQHFDYRKDYARAFKYIEEAIKHTPTIVELYMTKAKIFKHVGDLQSAMETMDLARKLDFQDRFINSKCAKYMLRNDCVEDAEKTAALFCKNFFDYFDDQFDFHNYNMRKMTVRAYLDLLRMEDRLKSHPFYFNAAVAAVRLYVQLLDKPSVEERERTAGGLNDLSESERRKAMRKARKAELASAGAANGNAVTAPVPASASASGHGSNALNNAKKKVDEDPDGLKLLDPAVLVSDCMKFLRPLLELSPGRIESQVLGAHVYIRKKNYLLALKCLKNAYRIDS